MSLVPSKRKSPAKAIIPMLVAPERFVDQAVQLSLAKKRDHPHYAQGIRDGTYPSAKELSEMRTNLRKGRDHVVGELWSSFVWTLLVVGLGLLIAYLLGRVAPDRPMDWGKFLSLTGGVLAGWATLFELGGTWETWDRDTLHEVAHPWLFRMIFLLGLMVAAVGQVW